MAIRFGGQSAPNPNRRLTSRTSWITAAASPLLVTAFAQDPALMAANLAGFAAIAGGMALTREGLKAEAAYDARPVAKRPAIPRKLFGGVLAGVGIALGAAEPGALAGAGIMGALAAVLHVASFGLDPLRDKRAAPRSFQDDRVARVVTEAEEALLALQAAAARTRDHRLAAEVSGFSASARALIARVEADPRALNTARRYLGVYLTGARDAARRYADLTAARPDAAARADFLALLADLRAGFAAHEDRLLDDSRADMDVEIAVLRDRLARDATPPPAEPAQLEHLHQTALDLAARRTSVRGSR